MTNQRARLEPRYGAATRDASASEQSSVLGRLRAARLRPTMARIGILQAIEASPRQSVSADEIYRCLMLRGTPTSIGTVYRGLHELQGKGLLLRELDDDRKALYRIAPPAHETATGMRLLCSESGRALLLEDPALHASLVETAAQLGMDLTGRVLSIHAAPLAECARHAHQTRL